MSAVLCCLQCNISGLFRARKHTRNDDTGGKVSDSDEKIDLVNDEGSNLQQDLWNLCFRAKIQNAHSEDYSFYERLVSNLGTASYTTSLQLLTNRYTEHGLARYVPQIRNVLATLEPFTSTIDTMVQSDPQIAALVWGSVQAVLHVRTTCVFVF